MTKRITKLESCWLARKENSTGFILRGYTAKQVEHEIHLDALDLPELLCGITKLSERAKQIIESERQAHRWARDRVAGCWRDLSAATGPDEAKP